MRTRLKSKNVFLGRVMRAIGRCALGVVALAVAGALRASEPATGAAAPVTFVFTSDVHFGINRGKFRGLANVEARVVSAAMVDAINGLPAAVLPNDGGVRAGRAVGPVDFVAITGDLTNRQERLPLKIQSASASWAQFEPIFFGGLKVPDASGRPAPLLLVPGNHDVSNAIGSPTKLLPETDATPMAEMFNRMMRPAKPRTKDSYRYAKDKIIFSREFGGAHCVFLTMWPDSGARAWIDSDLRNVPPTTPVFLFCHDQPDLEAKHLTNPNGSHGINGHDKFENVVSDIFTGGKTVEGETTNEQRALVAFLKKHRNIVGYFHGNANWNEFYTGKGPDGDVALSTFRADSPMKGKDSGKDETKLSFQVVVFDVAAKKLTSRECLWNAAARAGSIAWGSSTTVSLAPR